MKKIQKISLVIFLIGAMLLAFSGCSSMFSVSVDTDKEQDIDDYGKDAETTQESEEDTEKKTTENSTDNVTDSETLENNQTNTDYEDDTQTSDNKETSKDSGNGSETDAGTENKTDSEDDTENDIVKPTTKPTETSATKPAQKPTVQPTTEAPTTKPTQAPTTKPTQAPTTKPTQAATTKPTQAPTTKPTQAPTTKPTQAATTKPAQTPTTQEPYIPGGSINLNPNDVTGLYTELAMYSNISRDEIVLVRTILNDIITNDMSDIQKIKTVHDWLVKNTTYDASYYSRSDSHNHLYNILYNKIGVCQTYSIAFYVFLGELGIPCTFVVGDANNGGGNVGHAWNFVKVNNEWYGVDVTWDDPIVNGTSNYSDGSNVSYTYMLCTYNNLSKTHFAENYVKSQPTTFGTSNEYNNLMYKMSGYTDVFRITSYEQIDGYVSEITSMGKYVIFMDDAGLDKNTVWDEIIESLRNNTNISNFTVEGMLGSSSVTFNLIAQ